MAEVLLFHHAQGQTPGFLAFAESAEQAELLLYPGDQHLFADASLSSYDKDAAALLTKRVLAFLSAR